ncbi:MAG: hypothetical protein ABIP14_17365 [Blastocatellia bacterium]
MNSRKETNAVSKTQVERALFAAPGFSKLSAEAQLAVSQQLTDAYAEALSQQRNFDADEAIQTLQDDGLAAEFLNQLAFPKFVSDLMKGVFDANARATFKQMQAYIELMKACQLPLARLAEAIADNAATKYLKAIAPESMPYSKAELKAARLSLASQQRRLLRQTVLIGMARLMVDSRTRAGKAFLGINAARDLGNPALREKIIRALHGPKPFSFDIMGATAGELSGAIWVQRFPGSTSVSDLEPTFGNNVNLFLAALRAAGAGLRITSTLRPPERAYMMHFAWSIVRGLVAPNKVPAMPGVAIIWDHGDAAASRRGAQQMVDGFGLGNLKVAPALNSRHTARKAIDAKIAWNGALTIKRADGQAVIITSEPRNGINPDLIKVGATYKVIHFFKPAKDVPHWSTDGR